MENQNTPSSEIEELKREVRELREQVALLREFVRVQPADPAKGVGASAQVRCSSLVLAAPDAPQTVQAVLASSPTGGQLSLQDDNGKPTLQAGSSGLFLLGPDGQPAVEVAADEDTGRGRVLVMEEGNPRAVLKATPDGGCVSVLHDDGRPRASLLSTNAQGADLLMITPDLKPGIRISSGAPHGGMLSVHRENGKPAISLMCGPSAAGVAIRKADGSVNTLS